ncbi:hypothetical protein [Alcanivorax sp. 24]|uniref:hypothetical protein n=1 Tax=Alcanivorax sp. 24 TaxID=2545266 RepID=UPI00105D58F9|nr:hypothetical protein [Alcanivorax sp. 24]
MRQQLPRGGDSAGPSRFACEQVQDALRRRVVGGAVTGLTVDLAMQDLSLSRCFLEQWWWATVHWRVLGNDLEAQAPTA